MSSIIVAFPKIEDAKAIKNLLVRNGYDVAAPCISGAQVINLADSLSDGIIVCGYKLGDMVYSELYDYKPKIYKIHNYIIKLIQINKLGYKAVSM